MTSAWRSRTAARANQRRGRWWRGLVPVALALLAACRAAPNPAGPPARLACLAPSPPPDPGHARSGMVLIKGGLFAMGARAERAEEGPAHPVRVADFWIDRTDVTNDAFARFVAATGYRTLAERPLDPALYPGLPKAALAPASLVFVGARAPVDRNDPSQWWRVVPGADWRHPQGPGSSIKGRGAFPVIQIGYDDALAYARWLGRDLPTEAEWEYAARGGLQARRYAWGDQPPAKGAAPRANTWQGVFPVLDTGADGYRAGPSPVGCFPANGFGLYDMAGNVWQWTRDLYRPGPEGPVSVEEGGAPQISAYDPADPQAPRHVIKGGSFLCSDDFCYRYRPAARTAGPPDSGASHIGFRTVWRPPTPPGRMTLNQSAPRALSTDARS